MTPSHATVQPSKWVMRFLPGIPRSGPVADIACGSGRHVRAILAEGLTAIGVDRDLEGLDDLNDRQGLTLIQADLEDGSPFPIQPASCAGVIVTNYLWRPIIPSIIACIRLDGVLIYETFASGNERVGKPSNPDFLLKPGELIEAVAGRLTPIAYEHLTEAIEDPIRPDQKSEYRVRQRICAVGPDHNWLNDPPRS